MIVYISCLVATIILPLESSVRHGRQAQRDDNGIPDSRWRANILANNYGKHQIVWLRCESGKMMCEFK